MTDQSWMTEDDRKWLAIWHLLENAGLAPPPNSGGCWTVDLTPMRELFHKIANRYVYKRAHIFEKCDELRIHYAKHYCESNATTSSSDLAIPDKPPAS